MKKLILFLLFASPLLAQRPTGTVISGSTSAGVPATIRTSAAGEVYITTAAGILAQRPTGTVVSGATSAGIPQTFLTETDGTLHVTCTGCGAGDLAGTLTATRVPFASGASTLVDDADLTFTGGNLLHATNLIVGSALTNTALAGSGTRCVNASSTGVLGVAAADCGSGGGGISGTIAANQIAFGAGVDEIAGDDGFTYDPTAIATDGIAETLVYSKTITAAGGATYAQIKAPEWSLTSTDPNVAGIHGFAFNTRFESTVVNSYSSGLSIGMIANSDVASASADALTIDVLSAHEMASLNAINIGLSPSASTVEAVGLKIQNVTGATNNYAIKTGAGKVDFASGGFVFDPTLAATDAGIQSLELTRTFTSVAMEAYPWAKGAVINLVAPADNGELDGILIDLTNHSTVAGSYTQGVQLRVTADGDSLSGAIDGLVVQVTSVGNDSLGTGVTAVSLSAIAGAGGAATATALNIASVTGATTNRSILTGTGIAQFGDDVWAKNGSTWKDVHAANFVLESSSLNAGTTDAHSGSLSVYDVNGTAFRDFLTWTNGNAPSVVIGIPTTGTLAIDATTYKVGGVTPLTVCTAGVIKVTSGIVLDFGALVTC